MTSSTSRRSFLRTLGVAALAAPFVGRLSRGVALSASLDQYLVSRTPVPSVTYERTLEEWGVHSDRRTTEADVYTVLWHTTRPHQYSLNRCRRVLVAGAWQPPLWDDGPYDADRQSGMIASWMGWPSKAWLPGERQAWQNEIDRARAQWVVDGSVTTRRTRS